MTVRATGLGRDAIFLDGVESPYDLTMVCRAAVALGAKGFALAGGFRFERPQGPLDVLLIQTGDEGAIVFEAATPRGQEALRAAIATVDPAQPVAGVVRDAVMGDAIGGVNPLTDSDRYRLYCLGGSDLATVRRIARLSPDKRKKTLVFLAGMLGQDIADRLGTLLNMGRVFQEDIPAMMMYALIRFEHHPEMVSRVLLALADEVPPVENAAIHLALGPQA